MNEKSNSAQTTTSTASANQCALCMEPFGRKRPQMNYPCSCRRKICFFCVKTQVELECTPSSIIEKQNNIAGGYTTLFMLCCPLCNMKVCDPDIDEEKYTRSRSLEVHPRVVSIEDVETISMKESGYRDYKYAYLEETLVGMHPVDQNIAMQVLQRARQPVRAVEDDDETLQDTVDDSMSEVSELSFSISSYGRRSYRCGICRQTGHNRRNCPQQVQSLSAPIQEELFDSSFTAYSMTIETDIDFFYLSDVEGYSEVVELQNPYLLRSDSTTTRIRAIKEVKPKYELVDFEYFPGNVEETLTMQLHQTTTREDDDGRTHHVLHMWREFKEQNPTMGNEGFVYQRVHISLPMAFIFRGDYAVNQLRVQSDSVRLKVNDYYVMAFNPYHSVDITQQSIENFESIADIENDNNPFLRQLWVKYRQDPYRFTSDERPEPYTACSSYDVVNSSPIL